MATKSSRTIIRDPRKTKRIKSALVAAKEEGLSSSSNNDVQLQKQQSQHHVGHRARMSFEPSADNQRSLGLGSYMLAGVGVAMGVTLVGAVFGAIG
eukprot:CAMPEP_0201625648 /NCGR_PEP_ID=MMETSP0493-20130528/1365_1 /ASSEMBLY_ACC=CAM_ASM_000838 /TAXON_ID=420259 /ORGANISM="Thalassiosira gravida, Strain GMp14c1" /LENGTH=95 /DNA_ID=CAMNT_0048095653 /DNA_START=37 /DNA_END=324 /DNA_ORIENTATION=-